MDVQIMRGLLDKNDALKIFRCDEDNVEIGF